MDARKNARHFVDSPHPGCQERQCAGKVGYPTKNKARVAAGVTNKAKGWGKMDAYKCGCAGCGRYHIGHRR